MAHKGEVAHGHGADKPCPECGRLVSGNTNISPLKHAVYCLHVEPGELVNNAGKYAAAAAAGDVRAQRIRTLAGWQQWPENPRWKEEPNATPGSR